MSGTRILTTGRLDGLTITPVAADDGELKFFDFTVSTLPGLRLIVEAAAARELHEALGVLLREPMPPAPPIPSDADVCTCGRARGSSVHADGALNGHPFKHWQTVR